MATPTADHARVRDLPWRIDHRGPRAGHAFQPTPVRSAAVARSWMDDLRASLIRIWLANLGAWEAIVGVRPGCTVACEDEGVDRHLAAWSELVETLVA
ncbi:MAG: hypothetical protein HY264_02840 [Chloroflexi bacterium]|nr:hypothetical protein [Chloroflexota bacterium]